MTTKSSLSGKKITSQNISISSTLKKRIESYVRKMNEDERYRSDESYKSISAFYCHVMENVLNIFKKGKNLDDFDRLIDKHFEDLINKFTYNAGINLHEFAVEENRYTPFSISSMTARQTELDFFMKNFYKKNYDIYNFEKFKLALENFKKFALSNKITKDFNFYVEQGKDRNNFTGIIEFSGYYKNLHFLNCKDIATFFGSFGLEIIKVTYSPENTYIRFDIKNTEWFLKEKVNKKLRIKLIKDNLNLLVNYNRIVSDDDHYLWIRMAKDNEILLSFENQETRDKWIKKVEDDIQKFGSKGDFLLKMLEFFERIHWIKIFDRDELSFEIKLSNEKHGEDLQFLFDYFSKKSGFFQKGDKYYLGKKN